MPLEENTSWFVFTEGQQHGPVAAENLVAFLAAHTGPPVYVWRDGFADWMLASDVPELTVSPQLAPPPQVLLLQPPPEVPLLAAEAPAEAVTPVEPEQPSGRRNFVARHWRGDLPLCASYWLIVWLGNIVFAALGIFIAKSLRPESGYNPLNIFGVIALTWSSVMVVVTWQLVGTWRSANRYARVRHQARRSAFWGRLAQVAVILGAVGNIVTFVREGAPQLVEVTGMAFRNDPEVPDYSIRVMRDGTEAEIVGGFKFGLTDDFVKILAASRQITVVHLDSIGGRLGEGEKMFKLIRDRGLNTYVSSKCLSACTLAFAGGRQRYLHKDAALGFHKGTFPGVREGDFDTIQRTVFRSAGFDETFISTALSTPHNEMWRPSPQALVRAKVVTSIADGTRFAFSGLGADLSKDRVAKVLAGALPVFDTIRTRFPDQYDALAEEYYNNLVKGKTEAETIEALRGKLMPFIRTLLPMADDEVLADYNRLLQDQYRELSAKDPSRCYMYASGEDTRANFSSELSKAVLQQELSLNERAVKTATKREPA